MEMAVEEAMLVLMVIAITMATAIMMARQGSRQCSATTIWPSEGGGD